MYRYDGDQFATTMPWPFFFVYRVLEFSLYAFFSFSLQKNDEDSIQIQQQQKWN